MTTRMILTVLAFLVAIGLAWTLTGGVGGTPSGIGGGGGMTWSGGGDDDEGFEFDDD